MVCDVGHRWILVQNIIWNIYNIIKISYVFINFSLFISSFIVHDLHICIFSFLIYELSVEWFVQLLHSSVNPRDGEGTASTGHEPHTRKDKSPTSIAKELSASAVADTVPMKRRIQREERLMLDLKLYCSSFSSK